MNLRLLPLLGVALAACASPDHSDYGALEITTSSTTSTSGFTTSDGWNVKVNHFYVHVSEVTVAGFDDVVTATIGPQVVDAAIPGPKSLLFAENRIARPWERVSLRIGPAALVDDVAPAPVGTVTTADVDALVKAGVSLSLDGVATRGAESKRFVWGFTTDTLHEDCAGEVDGGPRPGLLVPVGGTDVADVVLSSSAFFSDQPDPTVGVLRFDPFSAADADKNGDVTLDELAASGLGERVTELSRRVVSSFRAKGRCTATPAPETTE